MERNLLSRSNKNLTLRKFYLCILKFLLIYDDLWDFWYSSVFSSVFFSSFITNSLQQMAKVTLICKWKFLHLIAVTCLMKKNEVGCDIDEKKTTWTCFWNVLHANYVYDAENCFQDLDTSYQQLLHVTFAIQRFFQFNNFATLMEG